MNDKLREILQAPVTGKGDLIPLLQKAQEAEGYVSEEAIYAIAEKLRIPASEVFGVLSFYAQFRLRPMGKHNVKICRGTACHVRGSPLIVTAVESELQLGNGEDTTPDGLFTVEKIACFGACSLAPVMVVGGRTYGNLSPDKARRLIRKTAEEDHV
ncbi:MAG: NAD(P)H-dependent oxidoreductase subunit E [Anaerolineae bacterium]|nr:NAD(P)H-dependent oxidoreductase subunit E [Anaerolineae bacterium]